MDEITDITATGNVSNMVPTNRAILKTGAEIQSGLDRQRWAELLILQLPSGHDGRNSWLLNYGVSDEAQALRNDEFTNIEINEIRE